MPKTTLEAQGRVVLSGRPANLFSMPPAQYKLWEKARVWRADPAGLFAELGATGKSGDGRFLLDVLCVQGFPKYAYTRLRSFDNTVDFAFPAVMRLSQLARLQEVWELEDLTWTESPLLGLNSYPKSEWTFPRAIAAPTSQETWFLSYEDETRNLPQLNLRAGWATYFSKSVLTRRLVTLMGPGLSTLKKLLDVVKVDEPGKPFAADQSKAAVAACLDIGADYFERKLLKPSEGKLLPYVPHAQLISMNPANCAGLGL